MVQIANKMESQKKKKHINYSAIHVCQLLCCLQKSNIENQEEKHCKMELMKIGNWPNKETSLVANTTCVIPL
jgi:hypothetical protein